MWCVWNHILYKKYHYLHDLYSSPDWIKTAKVRMPMHLFAHARAGNHMHAGASDYPCTGTAVGLLVHHTLCAHSFAEQRLKQWRTYGKFLDRPLPFTPLQERSWYFNDLYSSKALSTLLKNMTVEADLEGNFTKHSLRATGATVLYDADIP